MLPLNVATLYNEVPQSYFPCITRSTQLWGNIVGTGDAIDIFKGTHLALGPLMLRLSTSDESEESKSPLMSLAAAAAPGAAVAPLVNSVPPAPPLPPPPPPSGFRMSPKASNALKRTAQLNKKLNINFNNKLY